MGKAKKPLRVKLIIGMLSKNKKLFELVEEFFIKEFGEIDYRSPILPFEHTDYYKEELGHPLKRIFISFSRLIDPARLPDIKLLTNSIEQRFAKKTRAGILKRRINIDPGYITDAKLILATTKDYSHRVYLNKGVYAEVTLYWHKNSFNPFQWTYPDYRTPAYIELLNKIRNKYMQERLYEKRG